MKRFILPFVMSFFFVAESIYVDLFPIGIFESQPVIVPRFVMILLIFTIIYLGKLQGMIYGAIFGLLYDLIYTEILGVYLFAYPVISYMVSKISKILQSNLFIIALLSLIAVSILEFYIYGVNIVIGYADIGAKEFLQSRLLPTLVLNCTFIIMISVPIKRLLIFLSEEE
ncbi:rod shape-determining protein MreD [Bacillus timonensis]|nr:rod shape-determining protein MreD [Bacillus timonensis]